MKYGAINIDNYPLYLIDRIEGKLTDAEEKALSLFLIQHPELDAEEDFKLLTLKPENFRFDGSTLKKPEEQLPPFPFDAKGLDEWLAREMEGDLTEEEQEALRVFIHYHPHAEKDQQLIKATRLPDEKPAAPIDKSLLYHLATEAAEKPSVENIDDYLAALMEGDLDEQEEQALNDFLAKHSALQKEAALLPLLRLSPDEEITFPDKNKLKKRAPLLPLWSYKAAAVAAILLLVWLSVPLRQDRLKLPDKPAVSMQVPVQSTPSIPKAESRQQPEPPAPIKTQLAQQHKTSTPSNRGTTNPRISLQHMATIKAHIKQEPANILHAMPDPMPVANLTYAKIPGYYRVTVEPDNFLTKNKDLTKKMVASVRKLFHINPKDIKAPKDKLTLWDAAYVGVRSLGIMTENDFTLSRN